jgi:hypothetical protein
MNTTLSRRGFLQIAAAGAIASGLEPRVGAAATLSRAEAVAAGWSLNATIIEACSCPMFCPCYFSTVPSGHGHGSVVEHFCRFNMGYRVNQGNMDNVLLNWKRRTQRVERHEGPRGGQAAKQQSRRGRAAKESWDDGRRGRDQQPALLRAPRNTGFMLMPNEVNAYRVGQGPFEFKGTTGFMITYDITSKDVRASAG